MASTGCLAFTIVGETAQVITPSELRKYLNNAGTVGLKIMFVLKKSGQVIESGQSQERKILVREAWKHQLRVMEAIFLQFADQHEIGGCKWAELGNARHLYDGIR
jgi:hypothetical protein